MLLALIQDLLECLGNDPFAGDVSRLDWTQSIAGTLADWISTVRADFLIRSRANSTATLPGGCGFHLPLIRMFRREASSGKYRIVSSLICQAGGGES